MTVSETIEAWSKDDSLGFVEVEGRGWVNTQKAAQKYVSDPRRLAAAAEWEASAVRFMQAVTAAERWCSSPEELQEFEEATKEVRLELPWENGVKPRNEWWRKKRA